MDGWDGWMGWINGWDVIGWNRMEGRDGKEGWDG